MNERPSDREDVDAATDSVVEKALAETPPLPEKTKADLSSILSWRSARGG